ncbi:MAG: peptidylprolyl isomerase [Candidatus Eisenbacteria bacterium]
MNRWNRVLVPAIFLAGVILVPACSGGDATHQATAQNQTKTEPAQKTEAAPAAEKKAEAPASPLMNPNSPEMNQTAPDVFKAKFETSAGTFVIEAHRDWSPLGVDRFYNLVKNGYYDDVRFFRVIKGFMAQFGIHGDPKLSSVWRNANIKDEPVKAKNTRGMVSYAKSMAPNSRSTQLFINYRDNSGGLDSRDSLPSARSSRGWTWSTRSTVTMERAHRTAAVPIRTDPGAGERSIAEVGFPCKLDYIEKASIVTPSVIGASRRACPSLTGCRLNGSAPFSMSDAGRPSPAPIRCRPMRIDSNLSPRAHGEVP